MLYRALTDIVIGVLAGPQETEAPTHVTVVPFVYVPTNDSGPTDREIEEADQVMDNEPLT